MTFHNQSYQTFYSLMQRFSNYDPVESRQTLKFIIFEIYLIKQALKKLFHVGFLYLEGRQQNSLRTFALVNNSPFIALKQAFVTE